MVGPFDEASTNEELEKKRELIAALTLAYKEEAQVLQKLTAVTKAADLAERSGSKATEALRKEQEKLQKQYEESDVAILKEIESLNKSTEALRKKRDAMAAMKGAYNTMAGVAKKAAQEVDDFAGTQYAAMGSIQDMMKMASKWAMELNKMHVEIRRGTGYVDRYSDLHLEMRDRYLDLGRGAGELSKNIISLSRGFNAFDAQTKTARKTITDIAGQMNNLGASTEEVTKFLNDLYYTFGMIAKGSEVRLAKAQKRFEKLGESIGLAFDVVVRNFSQLAPELARFGTQGETVFNKLQKLSRRLGLDIKQAFDISELFDTFESASNTVGRLNAQFGTQLNTIELMKASSSERLSTLREEFKERGIQWSKMGKRQRQMMGNILGVSVLEAGKLLGEKLNMNALAEKGAKARTAEEKEKDKQRKLISQEQLKTRNRENQLNKLLETFGGFKNIETVNRDILTGVNESARALGIIQIVVTTIGTLVGAAVGANALLGAARNFGAIRSAGGIGAVLKGTAPAATGAAGLLGSTTGAAGALRTGAASVLRNPATNRVIKPGGVTHLRLIKSGALPSSTLPAAASGAVPAAAPTGAPTGRVPLSGSLTAAGRSTLHQAGKSAASKVMGKMGVIGAGISAVGSGADEYARSGSMTRSVTRGAMAGGGAFGGMAAGAYSGASVGLLLGPVGAAVGGFIGGILGGFAGQSAMESVFGGIFGKSDKEKRFEKSQADNLALSAQAKRAGEAAAAGQAGGLQAGGAITIKEVIFPITLKIDGTELTPVVKRAVNVILNPVTPQDTTW
jgi:hypothetical protein